MKIPAIRAQIGSWIYYVATLSFKQVSSHVKRIDDELHKSTLLRQLLQRSISNNYKNIANYIETQEERFFNAIILAVYDGEPQWHEVRLEYENGEEFFNLGVLELTGNEKIFPVDGQHRVEGIKKVTAESSKYDDEQIPVIFIGHKKDDEGMKRARRMFSTLNRYAKPVSMRDVIALDEDDIIAIASRELIDNHVLFSNGSILDAKTKAIPEKNKSAFTTIIAFYECNKELLWMFIKEKNIKNLEGTKIRGKSKIKEYIRVRPSDKDIDAFINICIDFWNCLMNSFSELTEYANRKPFDSSKFRNKEGGLLLFRPVGLIPFIRAAVRVKEHNDDNFLSAFSSIPHKILYLNNIIWKNVLWNPDKKTMIMNNQHLTELILLYYWDNSILSDKELLKIKKELKSIRQLNEDEDIEELLKEAIEVEVNE